MVCSSCGTSMPAGASICTSCGTRATRRSGEPDWRDEVREKAQRHKAKKQQEKSRHDDDARQLTIFPATEEEEAEEERVARERHAEIRARVEQRLEGARRTRPITQPIESEELPLTGGRSAAAALAKSEPEEPMLDLEDASPDAEAEELRDPTQEELEFDAGDVDAPFEERLVDGEAAPALSFGLATPGERFFGGLIDSAFVALIQLTLFYLTTHLVARRAGALPTSALVAMGVVGGLLAAGYFLFFWSLSGQTLGKLITGGRVVPAAGGGALGARRAALRLVGLVASIVPLGAGFIGLWTDGERRGWHDRLAGTRVVRG